MAVVSFYFIDIVLVVVLSPASQWQLIYNYDHNNTCDDVFTIHRQQHTHTHTPCVRSVTHHFHLGEENNMGAARKY